MKATHAKAADNEPEAQQSVSQPKVAVYSESGRRYRYPQGHSSSLARERVMEREMVKATEKEVEGEPTAFQLTSSSAAVSSCTTNGESDVETLLAKLRAL